MTQELLPIDFEKLKVGDEVVCDEQEGKVVFISENEIGSYPVLVVFRKEDYYVSDWFTIDDIFQKPKPVKKLWIAVQKNIGNYEEDGISVSPMAFEDPIAAIELLHDETSIEIEDIVAIQIEVPE